MKTIASLFSLAMQANCNAKKGTIPSAGYNAMAWCRR